MGLVLALMRVFFLVIRPRRRAAATIPPKIGKPEMDTQGIGKEKEGHEMEKLKSIHETLQIQLHNENE